MLLEPHATSLRQRVSRELLPYVRQPAQYIGREWNQLVQDGDWQRAKTRVAVAFPDAYTVGMSHLGCQIIYAICNELPGVCAERVYCPMPDAEQIMRHKRMELFTWDTRQPVRQAHILAVSLQHELTCTNLLTMLDLAGIPLRQDRRADQDPLVLAGGPLADNPEPLADFLDLLIVGDAEPSLPPFLEAFDRLQDQRLPRRRIILELAKRFQSVYAPALYDVAYNPDGTVQRIRPSLPDLHAVVKRCCTPDLDAAASPQRPLVPHTQVVHDRISIEVMRGCPHRCRFCHAAYTKRPVTARSTEQVVELAEQAWHATGQEEIGLLSLSTGDYPHLPHLLERLNDRFVHRHVNVAVPSLRVDRILRDLPRLLRAVRKPSLTFAPEVATDRLRCAIGKNFTNEALFDGLRAAYQAGWRSVKLYFLCGLPGETQSDVEQIWHLAARAADLRRQVSGSPAAVSATISWLVPKPHTPLQWAPQPRPDYFARVRRILKQQARRTPAPVSLKFHHLQRSVLEAVLARGDRRLAPAIELAWRFGARFDAWSDHFRPRAWERAFRQAGVDPDFYAHRQRGYDELLPWAHLEAGLPAARLRRHAAALTCDSAL